MSPDNIFEGANESGDTVDKDGERKLGYGAAVVETMAQIMREDESVFIACSMPCICKTFTKASSVVILVMIKSLKNTLNISILSLYPVGKCLELI